MSTNASHLSSSSRASVALALTIAWCALLLQCQQPPPPKPVDAPPKAFSAARAWKHILQIAKEPHPAAAIESKAHAAVRHYIQRQLSGLCSQLHLHTMAVHHDRNISARLSPNAMMTLRSILCRIPGSESHTTPAPTPSAQTPSPRRTKPLRPSAPRPAKPLRPPAARRTKPAHPRVPAPKTPTSPTTPSSRPSTQSAAQKKGVRRLPTSRPSPRAADASRPRKGVRRDPAQRLFTPAADALSLVTKQSIPATHQAARQRWGKAFAPGKRRALMLLAHYDSATVSPGASDDGAGVAAILETLRALKHLPRPKRDLIVCITDGEEAGLFGAKSLFKHHPWTKDVALVLNFEARGSSGPSLLFETSPQNGRLVQEFSRVLRHPRTSSLSYEVYRLLPNDTDLTVFRRRGIPGINFAFIEKVYNYHQPTDTPQNLSPRSLQHHGENMLSLTRHFGNHTLRSLKAPDVVFFDLFGRMVVHYSQSTAIFFALLLFVLLCVALALAKQRQQLRLSRVLLMTVAPLLMLFVCGIFAYFFGRVLRYFKLHLVVYGDFPQSDIVHLSVILCTAALWLLLLKLFLRDAKPLEWALGFCFLFQAFLWTTIALLPGASFLFAWPLSFATLSCLILARKTEASNTIPIPLLLADLGTLALLAPVSYHLFYAFGFFLSPVSTCVTLLFFGACFSLQHTLLQPRRAGPLLLFLLSLAPALIGLR